MGVERPQARADGGSRARGRDPRQARQATAAAVKGAQGTSRRAAVGGVIPSLVGHAQGPAGRAGAVGRTRGGAGREARGSPATRPWSCLRLPSYEACVGADRATPRHASRSRPFFLGGKRKVDSGETPERTSHY